MSATDGTYSIRVPGRKVFIVNAQEADHRMVFSPDVIPTGYLDQDQTVMFEGNRDLVLDFILKPAGAFWLKTYDESGDYLFRQDVNNNDWRTAIYPLGNPPTSRPLQYINHQANTFWGWRDGSDKNHTVLMVPPDEPIEIWIYYNVPEIGYTFIHLDNGENGYTIKQGEVLPINFLYEAAKTEYRQYLERIDNYFANGYVFEEDILGWNEESRQLVDAMIQNCEEEIFGECISSAKTVLARTIRSREDAIFQAARQDIEKYKKEDVKLQIENCDGTPATGVELFYEQQTHDFIFGVGWPENGQLDILKEAGMNGAIQEAWWGEVISDDRMYDFHNERFDPIVQKGMDIVMHTGVWITPITNPEWHFVPRMILSMTPAEIAELARNFSSKVTEHYRDQMSIYDVFNEPQNAFFSMHISLDDVVNIAAASAEGAEVGAPDVPTYINFYFAYLGGDLSWVPNPYNENYPPPEEILKAILQKEVPFDNIGLEFYNDPSIDFGIYDDTIEHYSKYEKDIFISELAYNGNWREGTTDQTPAEWAKYAYTIAFSKPYVTGVVWIPGNNLSSPGYLFKSNGDQRPIVDTIGSLIQSWTTTGNGVTNGNGEVAFRGFTGQYAIRWLDPNGSNQAATFHVNGESQNDYSLKPESCQAQADPAAASSVSSQNSTPLAEVDKPFPFIGLGIFAGISLVAISILIWRRRVNE